MNTNIFDKFATKEAGNFIACEQQAAKQRGTTLKNAFDYANDKEADMIGMHRAAAERIKKEKDTCAFCKGQGEILITEYAPAIGINAETIQTQTFADCPKCNGTGKNLKSDQK